MLQKELRVVFVTMLMTVSFSLYALTRVFYFDNLTNISVNANGNVYIKWKDSPINYNYYGYSTTGCSGENYKWFVIQSDAAEELKELAHSLYIYNRPGRVDINGCLGAYPIVRSIYGLD